MLTSFFISTMIVSFFMFYSHPLILIILVIGQTLVCAWFLNQMYNNIWFSIIMVLIFLSALLIIFVYLSSLIPNEMMSLSWNILIPTLITMILLNPYWSKMKLSALKAIDLFTYSQLNLMIPNILLYMMITLSISVFISSMMKTPLKQEF